MPLFLIQQYINYGIYDIEPYTTPQMIDSSTEKITRVLGKISKNFYRKGELSPHRRCVSDKIDSTIRFWKGTYNLCMIYRFILNL